MKPQSHAVASPRRSVRGFTMVELLVVLMVLGILVAVVVGIGNYVIDEQHRTQTRSWQKTILQSVEKYVSINGSRPPKLHPVWVDKGMVSDVPQMRSRTLHQYLLNETGSFEIIRGLPTGAVSFDIPFHSTAGDEFYVGEFFDSYGWIMDWHPTGGAAGTPVLVSRGPDQDFGYRQVAATNPDGTEKQDEYGNTIYNEIADGPYDPVDDADLIEAQKDNIRSDGRSLAS